MTDKLSVILIQLDSLNRHFLSCYGNDWIKTPNLTAFAGRATIFDHHYVGSLPCMPARREIWAGTEEFWWRGWGPLEPWDQPIAYLSGQHGITTQLITDHYHLFEWGGHNYSYDFSGYEFVRGHEHDNWRTDPISAVPDWATNMVHKRGEAAHIYLRNVQDFVKEADFFGPRVMQATADWLDKNSGHEQFFLHVDCFDVHEPFHIPEPYRSIYTDDDYRAYNPWPLYGRIDSGPSALSSDQVDWVRAQFAGKLMMVDKWLGQVFDQLEYHKLFERTCIIVTTDHGHYLGEHGWMGKPPAPMYHTLCHIPLLVWHPDSPYSGQRIQAITQTVDLYATLLELLGVEVPTAKNIHSHSFAPVILGQRDVHRAQAIYGYNCQRVGITTDEWTLLRDQNPDVAQAYWYTHQVEHLRGAGWLYRKDRSFDYSMLTAGRFLTGVDAPVWRMPATGNWVRSLSVEPRPDLLFYNPSDPDQMDNVAQTHPDKVSQLETILKTHAKTVQAPEEQLVRLRLL